MKPIRFSLALLLCGSTLLPATAQDKVTNAFEDLKRSGTVQEQDSPMRQRATPEQVAALRATLPEAVQIMTLTPARLMKIDDRKGSIAPGKDADIVLFDDGINVSLTMIGGRVVYGK